jgi:hypothetical protein
MKRIHFIEIEDQTWFPEFLRNYVTDYLRFATNLLKLYHPAIDVLNRYVDKCDGKIIDLASGGGGPWMTLIPELLKSHDKLKVQLTDFFPNEKAAKILTREFPDIVTYHSNPVDAKAVLTHLEGLRTQFLSLHHFRPEDVQQIFSNAVEANRPILIMEGQERNILNVIKIALSPIPALFIMPFIRPFSLGRLFFTYIIPIIPFIIGFDGVVSVLRTYRIEELSEIARKADPKNTFNWEGGRKEQDGKVVLWFGGSPNIEKY